MRELSPLVFENSTMTRYICVSFILFLMHFISIIYIHIESRIRNFQIIRRFSFAYEQKAQNQGDDRSYINPCIIIIIIYNRPQHGTAPIYYVYIWSEDTGVCYTLHRRHFRPNARIMPRIAVLQRFSTPLDTYRRELKHGYIYTALHVFVYICVCIVSGQCIAFSINFTRRLFVDFRAILMQMRINFTHCCELLPPADLYV